MEFRIIFSQTFEWKISCQARSARLMRRQHTPLTRAGDLGEKQRRDSREGSPDRSLSARGRRGGGLLSSPARRTPERSPHGYVMPSLIWELSFSHAPHLLEIRGWSDTVGLVLPLPIWHLVPTLPSPWLSSPGGMAASPGARGEFGCVHHPGTGVTTREPSGFGRCGCDVSALVKNYVEQKTSYF